MPDVFLWSTVLYWVPWKQQKKTMHTWLANSSCSSPSQNIYIPDQPLIKSNHQPKEIPHFTWFRPWLSTPFPWVSVLQMYFCCIFSTNVFFWAWDHVTPYYLHHVSYVTYFVGYPIIPVLCPRHLISEKNLLQDFLLNMIWLGVGFLGT